MFTMESHMVEIQTKSCLIRAEIMSLRKNKKTLTEMSKKGFNCPTEKYDYEGRTGVEDGNVVKFID